MTQTPDQIVASSPMAEIEGRLGIDPIHVLNAQRLALINEGCDLRAVHGAFGTFDAQRKSQLAVIKMALRARAQLDKVKVTEASLDDQAHADPRYVEFVTEATKQRARLAQIEGKIEAIDQTIRRANVVARYVCDETRL